MKTLLNLGIASVWLINGLFFKVLNLVPRHEMIVSRILGESHAGLATKFIGVLEIFMAFWVLSGIKRRWCAILQVIAVAMMNLIEYFLVPDLLLFGRANVLVAMFFIAVVLLNEFALQNRR